MMTPTTRSPGGAVDDVDGLLAAYFQAEMPRPWPALRLPFSSLRTQWRRSWFAGGRSRFALAAAIMLLITGALSLGGAFRNVKQPNAVPIYLDPAQRDVKSDLFLEQSPDGSTTIRIVIDETPEPR